MKLLLCIMDDVCLYNKSGIGYFKAGTMGIFERFIGVQADLTLICQGKWIEAEDTVGMEKLEDYINLKKTVFVPKASKPVEYFTCLQRIKKVVDQEMKDADAMYVRYQGFSAFLACASARKYKVKQLVELGTDQWDAFWNHGVFGKILAVPMALFCKWDMWNAEFTHYVTEKALQKRYPTKGKMLSLTNAKIQSMHNDILDARLAKINRKEERICIGTAAAVYVRYKGQQYMIQALKVLKDQGYTNFEYQIAGKGDNSYLRAVAKQYGVEDQVRFMGTLSRDEIFPWLDSLDIYIQPSLQEGLPRAMIEAMSRALPCIGAKTAGIPELLEEEFVYSRKKDPEEIARRILALSDTAVLRKQATRNFDFAKRFEYDVVLEKRMAYYKEFLKEKANE